jgi:hypothetical protein
MNNFEIIDVKYNEKDNTVYVQVLEKPVLSAITVNITIDSSNKI